MPTPADYLDHITVVLHQPRFSENIGAAARAMHNMGLSRLMVVAPRNYDRDRALTLATHESAKLIENILFFDDLTSALVPFQWVTGTTARLGGQRDSVLTPEHAARKIIALAPENEVALLFGPEDRGLTNEDLRLCHTLINIPTAKFSSLNLAQAVMVMCYEVFKAGLAPKPPFIPRLATRDELDRMNEQVRDILVRICYIQPDNPDYWMHRLRTFFTRLELKAREVSMIRGICRQIEWFGKKNHENGRDNLPPI